MPTSWSENARTAPVALQPPSSTPPTPRRRSGCTRSRSRRTLATGEAHPTSRTHLRRNPCSTHVLAWIQPFSKVIASTGGGAGTTPSRSATSVPLTEVGSPGNTASASPAGARSRTIRCGSRRARSVSRTVTGNPPHALVAPRMQMLVTTLMRAIVLINEAPVPCTVQSSFTRSSARASTLARNPAPSPTPLDTAMQWLHDREVDGASVVPSPRTRHSRRERSRAQRRRRRRVVLPRQ
jgi:hypothetical protein